MRTRTTTPIPETRRPTRRTPRAAGAEMVPFADMALLCAHADDDAGMHVLAPGERCDRTEPRPGALTVQWSSTNLRTGTEVAGVAGVDLTAALYPVETLNWIFGRARVFWTPRMPHPSWGAAFGLLDGELFVLLRAELAQRPRGDRRPGPRRHTRRKARVVLAAAR